jgi:hypothetical protein
MPGQANVVVKGERAFVATGATRDVRGWAAPFLHADLSVDTRNHRLLSALVAPAVVEAPANGGEAEEPEPLDPRGSDLWLQERVIDDAGSGADTGTLRVPVSLAADQSVLIASDGGNPVPKDVSLVWVQNPDTPWAGPLLAAGGLLALVGGVLYLLAIDHDRRGLGPRRGRRGPFQGIRNMFGGRGSRRRGGEADTVPSGDTATMRTSRPSRRRARATALPVLGLAVALGISGCSASYWPQFGAEPVEEQTPEQPTSIAPVPVKDEQLHRIVERVAAVATAADDDLDAEKLAERFTGDALAQRTANYTIRAEMPDYGVVPPRLTDEELDYELVQSTESWPRTLFVTIASTSGKADAAGDPEPTEGEDSGETETRAASPSLALILTQETAQQNYLVSRVIALRGGISMPQAAPAEEGTALLANDLESLMLPPGEVGAAFATVLQDGADAPEGESFALEGDSLLENYGKARAEKSQQQSDTDDQDLVFTVTARQGDERTVALSTGVGGALVATTVIEEQIVEGGRYKPQAQDAVTALSGLEGEQERLVQEVAHQLLFFVPSKTDGSKIQLLGVTSELVGVRN